MICCCDCWNHSSGVKYMCTGVMNQLQWKMILEIWHVMFHLDHSKVKANKHSGNHLPWKSKTANLGKNHVKDSRSYHGTKFGLVHRPKRNELRTSFVKLRGFPNEGSDATKVTRISTKSNNSWGIQRRRNPNPILLLMAEILHHLGWLTPYK